MEHSSTLLRSELVWLMLMLLQFKYVGSAVLQLLALFEVAPPHPPTKKKKKTYTTFAYYHYFVWRADGARACTFSMTFRDFAGESNCEDDGDA